jgi:signal transduction histidine kinase
LTIADNGSGIHPEIKKKLFEPFVSTKGNTGCGLGRWVSSGIVQKHEGSINVRSNSMFPPWVQGGETPCNVRNSMNLPGSNYI